MLTDRRVKKRDSVVFGLHACSAASYTNNISYTRLINALTKAKSDINRKMLSEIAIADPKAFEGIVTK